MRQKNEFTMKYDVFISYSRKDSAIVKRFADELGKAGYTYWMDVDGVKIGDEFKRKIAAAIRDSRVFIYFSSASSNESEWTVKEVNYAIKNQSYIIPIKLDGANYNESVDFDLCGVNFIQCLTPEGFQGAVGILLRSVRSRIPPYRETIVEDDNSGAGPEGKHDNSGSCKANHFSCFGYVMILVLFVIIVGGMLLNNRANEARYLKLEAKLDSIAEKQQLFYELERLDRIIKESRSEKGLLCVAARDKKSGGMAYFNGHEWENTPWYIRSNYIQVGVSIRSNNHEFIIACADCKDPADGDNLLPYGVYGWEPNHYGRVRETRSFDSGSYYAGEIDTERLVEDTRGKNFNDIVGVPAAEAAWNYKAHEEYYNDSDFPNPVEEGCSLDNLQWYLPSIWELKVVSENVDTINSFIDKYVSGEVLTKGASYWSCTLHDDNDKSWFIKMGNVKGCEIGYRFNGYRVRAIAVAK